MIERKKGLWRGEGGVNEEIETEKATGLGKVRGTFLVLVEL